ncbi:CPBP family intramembrane glutamic endopeptidase [Halobacterium zhouii]|uniref:CPBP family intramembrane glutamic endopeptidase n=1 Tax=Halobacterium zhouii TaxID=2902624 RepID=UPI001E4A499E|nr:type II CAAX endopeptidase family protein [Halobacterium zhouii]
MDSETGGSKAKTVGVAFAIAILGFVVGILVSVLLTFAYAYATGTAIGDIGGVALLGISLVSLQGIGFPLTAWAYVGWSDRTWSFVPASVPGLGDLKWVGAGYVGAFAAVYLISILLTLTSTETASNSAATTALQNPGIIPVLIVLQLVLVGPGEELLFRGIIQGSLRERFSAPAAIVLASLTFAPAHILALSGGLAAVAATIGVLFVPSLIFGYVYEKTENIVAPALTHGLYNATLFTILYIAVSVGQAPQSLLGF